MFSLYKKVVGSLGTIPERERDPILGWRVPKLRNRGERWKKGEKKRKEKREKERKEKEIVIGERNRRRRESLEEWNGEEAAYGRTWTMT